MLEKCQYCNKRIRPRLLNVHLKSCPKLKAIRKKEFNKRVTQSLDHRLITLSKFGIEAPDNLESMPDLAFNDLIARHEAKLEHDLQLKKEKLVKLQTKQAEIELNRMKQELLDIKDKERRIEEEKQRMDQVAKEKIAFDEYQKNREEDEKRVELIHKVEIKEEDKFDPEELEKLESELAEQTQSLDYRFEILEEFENVDLPQDLETMSDKNFNDFVNGLKNEKNNINPSDT